MIPINNLRLFPFKTKQIRIPYLPDKGKYSVIIYPENSDFLDVYETLDIRFQDVRKVTVLPNIYPRLLVNAEMMKRYKQYKLMPVRTQLSKSSGNFYVDISPFLNSVDKTLDPSSYKAAIPSTKIKEYLRLVRQATEGTNKVFMYVVDIDKDMSTGIFHRKIYPILQMMKEEESFPFDYFILCVIKDSQTMYTSFVNPKDSVSYQRIFQLMKSLQTQKGNYVEIQQAKDASKNVMSGLNITPILSPEQQSRVDSGKIIPPEEIQDTVEEQKQVLRQALQDYLIKNPQIKDQLTKKKPDPDSAASIMTKAILYSVSGNLSKSEELVDNETTENKRLLLDRIRKELMSELVENLPPQNNATGIITGKVSIPGIAENKDGSHVLNKRHQDFKNSFEKDLKRCFDMLSKKPDFPLILDSISVKTSGYEAGDLEPTIEDLYTITLKDEKGRKHEVEIRVPHLMDDGTFLYKGSKKFLMYQIILDPIFFLKKWMVKLETLYAPMTIESKQMKSKNFFKIYISGYTIPLMPLLIHYLGFHDACKLFGIKYDLVAENPSDIKKAVKLSDDTYIQFYYDTEYANQLVASLREVPYQYTQNNILDKKAHDEAIIKMIGNRNCLYNINEVLTNILEPVSVQVLKTKLLPFTLPQCILYMCSEVVTGRVDDRNDLNQQRVRSSEVFNHQIIKQLLRGYTTYKFQRIAGDQSAKYSCDTDKVISDILNKSKLVRALENINPLEEISCLTRTTPIGPGGIPDKNAMTDKARGTHNSYYGNLDPMDTPEGSIFFRTNIKVDKTKSAQIIDVNIGDKILWVDGNQYEVTNKQVHRKQKYIIRTNYKDIECSAQHKWPVYDTKLQKEIVLTTEDIKKDIKRYKMIRMQNE